MSSVLLASYKMSNVMLCVTMFWEPTLHLHHIQNTCTARICVWSHVHVYAGSCACGGQRITQGVPPQSLSTLCFETSSLPNLKLANLMRLADHLTPGPTCPHVHGNWGYKHATVPSLFFLMWVSRTKVARQAFTNRATSPVPKARDFN